jgi:hypothetical protein
MLISEIVTYFVCETELKNCLQCASKIEIRLMLKLAVRAFAVVFQIFKFVTMLTVGLYTLVSALRLWNCVFYPHSIYKYVGTTQFLLKQITFASTVLKSWFLYLFFSIILQLVHQFISNAKNICCYIVKTNLH